MSGSEITRKKGNERNTSRLGEGRFGKINEDFSEERLLPKSIGFDQLKMSMRGSRFRNRKCRKRMISTYSCKLLSRNAVLSFQTWIITHTSSEGGERRRCLPGLLYRLLRPGGNRKKQKRDSKKIRTMAQRSVIKERKVNSSIRSFAVGSPTTRARRIL